MKNLNHQYHISGAVKSAVAYVSEGSGTNQLEKVMGSMSIDDSGNKRDMSAGNNFLYDRDGNMIEDKSKKMTVKYDHRGLPVEFKRESSSSENGADSVRLVLNYDGAGSRISKIRERKSAGETEWTAELTTHYTGIGSEIREDALNNATKVVVNLPQGLGRYDIENASNQYVGIDPEHLAGYIPPAKFEWYLKNHLGSTMLVYGTQSYGDLMKPNFAGLKSAYDYRAFGEQVDLTMPTDKVTETFTGKEKDDETELSYFGARYLDQMLGLWVSVDAKRQFNSPYLYAGNGTNPVNGVDEDGNKVWAVTKTDQKAYAAFTKKLNAEQAQRLSDIEKDPDIIMYFHAIDSEMKDENGNTALGFVVANEIDGFLGVVCSTCKGAQDAFAHEISGHGKQILDFLNGGQITGEHTLKEAPAWIEKNKMELEKDAFEVQGSPKTDEQLKDMGY